MNYSFLFDSVGTTGLYFEEPRPLAAAMDKMPIGGQGNALRFVLSSTDPNVSGSRRCEAVVKDSNGRPYVSEPFGVSRVYRLGLLLPAPWRADSKSKETLWQFHGKEDAGEARRGPVLQLYTFKDVWRLEQRTSKTSLQKSNDSLPVRLWGGLIQTNRVISWRVEVRWAWDDTGYLRCFKDDEKVVDETGPNCYNDREGPYLKFGIYKPSWAEDPPLVAPGVTQRTVFFSFVSGEDA